MRTHADVRALLPQRHPMLLVDRILEFRAGEMIRTSKAVTATEPCYAGLRDGAEPWQYHYPFSLLIESFGQSAALLWLGGSTADPGQDGTLMFVGATDFTFDGAALPGDVLEHTVRLETVISDTAFVAGETWVGERCLARVSSLVATRRPVRGAATGSAGATAGAADPAQRFDQPRKGSR